MKKLIILIFLFLFTQQSNFAQDNQQSVRDFVEGKYFKNHQLLVDIYRNVQIKSIIL
jgi:hypothetical protein